MLGNLNVNAVEERIFPDLPNKNANVSSTVSIRECMLVLA